MPPPSARPAVFLDRDGTIVVDTGYLARPEDVALLPGAGQAIARLNARHIPVIIVTNQSGIARGMYTLADFERVQARVETELARQGARVDAVYLCPHGPDEHPRCSCRKPGTQMHRDAALAHGLDLARSWYIGDRWRDVEPASTLGGHGVLVPTDCTPSADLLRAAEKATIATSLSAAVERVLRAC